MVMSIQELIDQNKDCPSDKARIAVKCTIDSLNNLSKEDFLCFCEENRVEITKLVTSLVIQKIYKSSSLANLDAIEFSAFHSFKSEK